MKEELRRMQTARLAAPELAMTPRSVHCCVPGWWGWQCVCTRVPDIRSRNSRVKEALSAPHLAPTTCWLQCRYCWKLQHRTRTFSWPFLRPDISPCQAKMRLHTFKLIRFLLSCCVKINLDMYAGKIFLLLFWDLVEIGVYWERGLDLILTLKQSCLILILVEFYSRTFMRDFSQRW